MNYRRQLIVFSLSLVAVSAVNSAHAAGPSSTNYAIAWDVMASGGGVAMSSNYTVLDSIAQPTPAGTSVSTNYVLTGGFQSPPDFDADRYRNFVDNCIFESNSDQRDTNGDGYGNLCDADLNNDGIVNPVDLGIFKLRFFTSDPDADFNGDGVVNPVDLGIIKLRFFAPPGPSGIAN